MAQKAYSDRTHSICKLDPFAIVDNFCPMYWKDVAYKKGALVLFFLFLKGLKVLNFFSSSLKCEILNSLNIIDKYASKASYDTSHFIDFHGS